MAEPKPKKPKKPATPKAAPASNANLDALRDQLWQQPDDRELLRVYGDALEQAGDPRGALIQLSLIADPTPEQREARRALIKKHKGALVGPAREYLREYHFGPNGLVEKARAEADKVIAGIDVIARVNPRLVLTITSVRNVKDAAALGAISLAPIYFVDFGWVTGTHGGCQLSDVLLETLAPALANVRHLQLSHRGDVDEVFTPDGLRALGRHTKQLRYLAIDYAAYRSAPPAAFARAIAETPGFSTLRALDFPGVTPGDLGDMKLALNAMGGSLNEHVQFGLADRVEQILA